jgi:nucleoside phosphorylase
LDLSVTLIVPCPTRATKEPVIHYGPIASGNQVIKHNFKRDRLGVEFGAYCVEMEATGLMNHYPCVLVRGKYDYADIHKDYKWQGYAAAVASVYAKELLMVTSISPNLQSPKVQELTTRAMCKS